MLSMTSQSINPFWNQTAIKKTTTKKTNKKNKRFNSPKRSESADLLPDSGDSWWPLSDSSFASYTREIERWMSENMKALCASSFLFHVRRVLTLCCRSSIWVLYVASFSSRVLLNSSSLWSNSTSLQHTHTHPANQNVCSNFWNLLKDHSKSV